MVILVSKLKHIEINVTINNKNSIKNIFNQEKLSNELSDYIYSECFGTPLKKHITLNIESNLSFSEDEKAKIIDIIRSSFGHQIRENMIHLKYDKIRAIYLFLTGLLFLTLSKWISSGNEFLFSEVLLIIGWVAIWEATYNFIFEDNKRRIEIKRLKKLTKCKINFI